MHTAFTYAIQPVGDTAILISLGDQIDERINQRVHALAVHLQNIQPAGIGPSIPGYATLLIPYDPAVWLYQDLATWLQYTLEKFQPTEISRGSVVEIPVQYGGTFGPDLAFVASYHQLSEDEVILIHASRTYPVFMMGFTPGFPYLGGMDERLNTPRLETPRQQVPAGAVGIAGGQTGIYSIDSPGGWRIIGKTEARLFDPLRGDPFLLHPGDRVRFIPVNHSGEIHD